MAVPCGDFLEEITCLPLFQCVVLDAIYRAHLGGSKWASSFAEALRDTVDPSLVHHLLAQRLTDFFDPTPDYSTLEAVFLEGS